MKKIFRNGLFTVLMTLLSSQIFAQFTGTIPVIQAAPGATVVVPILGQGSGINAFNIGVRFNPAVLTFQSVNTSGTPVSGGIFTSNLNGNQVEMAFVGSNLSVTDTLVKLIFTYNAQGGVSQLLWNREYTEFTGANNQLISETLINGALFTNAVPNLVTATNGDRQICELGTAQFTVTAAGATTFQWQRSTDGGASFTNLTNGAGVSGATSASLSIANQSQQASGNYFHCIVGNGTGNALSAAQRLKVNPVSGVVVTLAAAPAGAVCRGTSVTYSATPASTINNPVYQWRVNGVAAGNNATLVRNDLDQGDVVSCEISSADCISGSGNIVAQVSSLPTVFNVTGGGAYCAGGTGIAVGLAGSTNGVNYQLKLSGQAIGAPVVGTGQALNFGLQTTAGTYTVEATNTSNCVANMTGSAAISINPLPIANAGQDASIFVGNNTQLQASGGASYSWSPATGLSATNIANPVASPAVTTTYFVTVSSLFGCSSVDSVVVTVNQLPVVNAGADRSVCAGTAVFNLIGSPAGGTWSGNGITSASVGSFNPIIAGVGIWNVVYTVTDGVNYTISDTVVVTVNALPAVTFGSIGNFCVGAGSLNLTTGAPAGGTYSGPGIQAGVFSPSLAGVGTHVLYYSFTNGSGCSNMDSISVVVNPLPVVTLAPIAGVCVTSGLINLTGGSPVGGTYSGIGVSNGVFNPATAGVGTHSIVYTYTNPQTSCTASATATIVVSALPVVNFPSLGGYCINANPLVLNMATPAGGTYSGTGVNNNQFLPQLAGIGSFVLTYTYVDSLTGCSSSDTSVIVVNDIPVVTLNPFAAICASGNPFTLSGGLPLGGVYSGPGVVNGVFNPALAGAGTHQITYAYTDPQTGCGSSVSRSIAVTAGPGTQLTAASATTFCLGGTVNLTATPTSGVSYVWLLNNAVIANQSGNSLVASQSGAYRVVGTNSISGCADTSAAVTVTVNALPTAGLTAAGATTFCAGGSVVLNAAPTTGVTYVWLRNGAVVAGQTAASLTATQAGAYRVIVTNASSCFDTSAAVTVTVNALPTAGLTAAGATTICEGTSVLLNASPVTGVTYVWLRNGAVLTGQTSPTLSVTLAGDYRVIVTNTSSCFDTSATVTVTVNPRPSTPVISISATSDTLFSSIAIGNQWYLNGAAISGATSQTLVITQNGSYRAIVIDGNSCASDSSNLINVLNVGVREAFNLDLNLYPNPTNGKAWVSLDLPAHGTLEVEVLSVTGQRVHFEQQGNASGRVQLELNLQNVADGMYFVRVQQGAYIGMRRMVVRK
ncbi:MAG: T9SS type A sorting domain-containing protein [Sphingobacteriaceae bacterium]|nr:T9SS type A sorting domain-containing protein [Sphingobacteriaceae bacterium]